MKHMNLEWLAELADREPTAEERKLLDEDPDLLEEVEALQAQTQLLGQLPSLRPPRGDWATLEARLMSEGLIQSRKNTWLTLPLATGGMKVAAAVILFAGGAMTGSTLGGGSSDGSVDSIASIASIQTLGQAERAVEVSEQQYLNSLVRYRELSANEREPTSFGDPMERAAALDLLVRASQNALRQAPDDPFVNWFLMNTLAEQRATARQPRGQDNWF